MVSGFQPVEKVCKMFILSFKIQFIDIGYLHWDFLEVFKVITDSEGCTPYSIR